MLGLFAFFYTVRASFHVRGCWTISSIPAAILQDVFKRPYITAGSVGFLLMVPLAATSTAGMDPAGSAAAAGSSSTASSTSPPLPEVVHFLWLGEGRPAGAAHSTPASLRCCWGYRIVVWRNAPWREEARIPRLI